MSLKCRHRKPPFLGPIGMQLDAEKRIQNGEEQHRCPVCGFWIWDEFWPECEDGKEE